MNDFKKLILRIGVWRKYLFLLLLRAPFDAVRTWMLAGMMKAAFLCLETGNKDRLLVTCFIYGLICALLFFYNGTVWSIYAAFSAKAEAMLQKLLLEKLLHMPLRRVESHFSGEWITRLNSDVQTAFRMMNGPLNIPHLVVALINIVLSVCLMLRSSVLLLVLTGVFLVPHLLLNDKLILQAMPELKEASQKAMSESTSTIKPLITEAETILLYDAGDLMLEKCEESSMRLMQIHRDMHMRNALSGAVSRLFGSFGYLALLLCGAWMIFRGVLTFSEVVYCSQIRGSILAGVFMMVTCSNNIKANLVCVKRINDILEEGEEL